MQLASSSAVLTTEVLVTGGTGTGDTPLTAFDAALASAGIHDANLISVSSVTPQTATRSSPTPPELANRIEPGELVPAVFARSESDEPGTEVYAAVAGVDLAAGYGVNVETAGVNDPTDIVEDRCQAMLDELAQTRGESAATNIWIHQERTTVPDDGSVAGAVSALVYR